ncbi:succinate dehydrogenase [Streptomyces sp. NPDC002886]|uniref:succinate dehydrogenase n=1 Tax=Streptomyces sp. NPDC002886 TaxID=3364667 RepID=UPI0036B2445E
MALATRTDRRPSTTRTLWDSSVGKKSVMAVSGLIMLGYLVVHMLGNLKIFFGADEFNGYAHWLRTLGSPFLHHEWALWIVRVALVAAVVAHGVCAYQLSRRDIKARPVKYVHKRRRASYATRTMRWGGIILALFIVWHLLDLTTLTVNERAWAGHPYENVLATFSTWYGNTIYLVAMAALGLHVRHGFWSAAQTLGAGNARRDRTLKFLANALALVLFAGFVSVPVAVMTGVVS